MVVKTRLDVVVKLREREEDTAAQKMARAEAEVRVAQQRVEAARARAMADHRQKNDAAEWEMQELAQRRAVTDQKAAQKDLVASQRTAVQVRVLYTRAHQQAEVVRRVADSRREELVREEARLETKQLDEIASMLFVRKAG